VVRGTGGGYYYTPFPSPFLSNGTEYDDRDDEDDDDDDDEPDEMIRAKDHKWFLAPLVQCERAVGGSTIVRRSSAEVEVEDGAGARCDVDVTKARKLERRMPGRRPRFKLFHMEDDMEDKTLHQEKNEGLLRELLADDGAGPEGAATAAAAKVMACAGGEVGEVARAGRRGARRDGRACGLSRGEWPLWPVDRIARTTDSKDVQQPPPLSRYIHPSSPTCWRGRDHARYHSYLECRASPSFRAFMQMTEDYVDAHETPMDRFLFSVQLSFITTTSDLEDKDSDPNSTHCSSPPPRRRSDGDLLRKRVLEWNMVLNGKVSNVRAREDKAPRDPKRRSSCPAKLSTMRPIDEEDEGEEIGEEDHEFELESPPEMGDECDWFDGRHFQNR
jgi:hypothetical protein